MPKQNKCNRGHDLTKPSNVITKKNGDRQCRVCHRAATTAWADRKRAKEGRVKRTPITSDVCALESCDLPRCKTRSGRLRHCATHYFRLRVHGDAYEDVPVGYRKGRPLAESRLMLKDQGT